MTVSVTVLGCSGSYPGADCACSGYLIRHEQTVVAVDLGPGCLANLQRHIAITDLTAVVLSHSHADHWIDLTGLHVAMRYRFESRNFPVWGTAETLALANAVPGNLEPTFDWKVTGDGDEFAVGSLTFRTEATDHYVETLAMRIEASTGESLVYSADTGAGWSIEVLGRNVDLAIVESTYPTDEELGDVKHLSASMAGEMARAAGARRLLLTHFWPDSDRAAHSARAQATYGEPVLIAADNKRFEL